MSNPFGDDTIQDPFEDSGLPTEISNERYTDDFENPFSNDLGYSTVGSEPSHNNFYHKEGNNKGGYSKLTEDDLRIREESLRRREEALLQRENRVQNREINVHSVSGPANNWPSRCWAIAYHSIADDVPEEYHPLIKKFYAGLLFTWLCLSWNWLTMMICVLGGSSKHTAADTIWSIIYVVAGIPLSWRFWYRNVYYGVGERSTTKWCMFGLFFSAHTIFSMVMALGIQGTGAGGLFIMIDIINSDKHQSTVLLVLVALILWTLLSGFSVVILKQAHKAWKNLGQPKRLQQDLARTMVEQGMESGSV